MPDTILSALHALTHSYSQLPYEVGSYDYYYPYFTDEKTKAGHIKKLGQLPTTNMCWSQDSNHNLKPKTKTGCLLEQDTPGQHTASHVHKKGELYQHFLTYFS